MCVCAGVSVLKGNRKETNHFGVSPIRRQTHVGICVHQPFYPHNDIAPLTLSCLSACWALSLRNWTLASSASRAQVTQSGGVKAFLAPCFAPEGPFGIPFKKASQPQNQNTVRACFSPTAPPNTCQEKGLAFLPSKKLWRNTGASALLLS